jgi:hypothetical protein
MKTTLAIATLLGVLVLAGTAGGQTMMDITGAMGTANALSAGAANGASTAQAAMATAIRNLPTPPSGLGMADDTTPSHASGGTGGWATRASSSGTGNGWASPGKSSGTNTGWVTASSAHLGSSGTSVWAKPGNSSGSGVSRGWTRATDKN